MVRCRLYGVEQNENVTVFLAATVYWMFLLYYIKLTGSLVMEHPGTHPLPIQGKPTIFGGVNGSIGMLAIIIQYRVLPKILANFITSC